MHRLWSLVFRLFGALCLYWVLKEVERLVDAVITRTFPERVIADVFSLLVLLLLALVLLVRPESVVFRMGTMRDDPEAQPFDLTFLAHFGFLLLGLYVFIDSASNLAYYWLDARIYAGVADNEVARKIASALVYAVAALYGIVLMVRSKRFSRLASGRASTIKSS